MNEQTTLEIIAPTVEEAIAQGLSQLGLTADAVSIEVIDSGSKGFLGLGGRQVRVRLTVNPPPMPKVQPQENPQAKHPEKVQEKVQDMPQEKVQAKKPVDKPQEKPIEKRGEKPPTTRKESAPKTHTPKESKPAHHPPAEKKPAQEKPTRTESPAPKKIERAENDSLLNTTEAVVTKLIEYLGMKAEVSAHYDETSTDDRRAIQVDVHGDDLSALIGKHAETLTAFQHVASLIVGKEGQQWVQLHVDVEGYRSRREQQVKKLALRLAEQVAKTGRKAALEPMTSSERRTIHIELRNHPLVTTESTGEEPHRKVVILPKK